MEKFLRQSIFFYGIVSLVIGVIQIVIGLFDYNSIITGLIMSYKYFGVGIFFVATDNIIELLEKISKDSKNDMKS